MKNKTVIILTISNIVLALGIIAFAAFQGKGSVKMAYIQTGKVLNEYNSMIEARKVYQAAQWQANIDTLNAEWQRSVQKFQAEEQSMNEKERELSRQLLQKKQQELNNYRQAIQEQATQEDQEMTQKVITEINTFLQEYGKTQGYEIILAATDAGNIVYAVDALDITEEVVEKLNQDYTP